MGVAICRVDTYTDANDDVKCPMMPGDSTEVNVVGWVRVAEHPCCQPQWFMVRRTIVCSTIGSCRYYVVSASVIRSVGPKPSFEMMLIVMKKTGERKDDSSKFFIFRVTRTCGNRAAIYDSYIKSMIKSKQPTEGISRSSIRLDNAGQLCPALESNESSPVELLLCRQSSDGRCSRCTSRAYHGRPRLEA